MDFTLTDPTTLRVLSKTVHVAAKLSDHVQFTPHAPALHFRLLTPTHSTYAVFRFNQSFFSALVLPPTSTSYKISSRLLPPLLRAPQTIASVRLCTHQNNRLCLTVVTHTSLTKRFLLPLQDGRISSVRTTLLRNVLHTSAAFLSDLLTNFHSKLDEITLVPAQHNLTLLSFVDDNTNPSNAFLRTEITVDARQFDHYAFNTHGSPHADQNPNLTFMCRPLRSVVEFCDTLDVPIRISYDRPAAPLQLDIALPNTAGQLYFDALFVFASRVPLPDRTNQANDSEPAVNDHPRQQETLQNNKHNEAQETESIPAAPVDAMARPLPMYTETEIQVPNQTHMQQHGATAAHTPMRTPRRHGQQPLIPHPSQHHDADDDEPQPPKQHQPQSDREEEPVPAPLSPPIPVKRQLQKGSSSRTTESPPPILNKTLLNHSPSLPPPSPPHMTPVPESDPADEVEGTLVPESDPRSSRRPPSDSEEEEEGGAYVGDNHEGFADEEEGYEDEDDDDDDFVAGTPPPETQD